MLGKVAKLFGVLGFTVGLTTVNAATFTIQVPYTPSLAANTTLNFLSKDKIMLNFTITQYDRNYYPNCTLNVYLVYLNNSAVIPIYTKTFDVAFHEEKHFTAVIPTSNLKPGNYKIKWYISCGGYPAIGNLNILHFLSANPLGFLILDNEGSEIIFSNKAKGYIPKAYINKERFYISGSFSHFAP
jgi:hypothetical protein